MCCCVQRASFSEWRIWKPARARGASLRRSCLPSCARTILPLAAPARRPAMFYLRALMLAAALARLRADYLLTSTWKGAGCGQAGSAAQPAAQSILDVAYSFGCMNLTYPAGFTCTCNSTTTGLPGPCQGSGGGCFQCYRGSLPSGMACQAYSAAKLSSRTACVNETHSVTYFFPTDNCYGFVMEDDTNYHAAPSVALRLTAPLQASGAPACPSYPDATGALFSTSAICLQGPYERPSNADTFSTFFNYGTPAIAGVQFGGIRSQLPAPPLPPAGQSCPTKFSNVDTFDYVQRGPGGGAGGNCYPYLHDTAAPDKPMSISWQCASTMVTYIDGGSPDCNFDKAQLVTQPSASPTAPVFPSSSVSGSPRSSSVTQNLSPSASRSSSATKSAGYSVSAARTPSPSPSAPPVLAYEAPASGAGCVEQYVPQVRGAVQYPAEFMSSSCVLPPAPFKLTPGLIAAIALAFVGTLVIITVGVIAYLQARRALALRKARANSVRTLMHAASAANSPVVVDAMSVVAAPDANALAASAIGKRKAAGAASARQPVVTDNFLPVKVRHAVADMAPPPPPPPPDEL